MKVTFQKSKRIKAELNGNIIYTDQSIKSGGLGENPNPFEIFKASIGCCMGYYVMTFCMERNIPLDCILMDIEFEGEKIIDLVKVKIMVGKGFPSKYLKAIIKSTDACKIKKQMKAPPKFNIEVENIPEKNAA